MFVIGLVTVIAIATLAGPRKPVREITLVQQDGQAVQRS
jgi:hypothetical protein